MKTIVHERPDITVNGKAMRFCVICGNIISGGGRLVKSYYGELQMQICDKLHCESAARTIKRVIP